ncbi:MAG: glycosyltransferase [Planctomycetaceae bacterium]
MHRIAYVIPTLDRSGAERQLALLATGLPREQFEPHVFALTRGGPFEKFLAEHDVPVTILNKRYRFDPLARGRLKKNLSQFAPDVIHSFLFAGNAYSRLIAGKSDMPKVVCSERCVDSWKSSWQLWLDRRLAGRTDRLLANSQAVADFYQQAGVPQSLIHVIPNGVVDDGTATATERNGLRDELGVPRDAKLVVFAGRLAKQKRVHDLVWAFQLLQQTSPNTYFVICGDGPERWRVEQRIEHFAIGHLVKLLGHREDAAQIVRASDVFWLGSDFEGMSNSLSEAMMASLPCVATNIAPNEELIEHGTNGFLATPGDSVAFQQFTLDLLTNPEDAHAIGKAARSSMLDRFSVQRMIDAHVLLYEELLA